MANSPLIPQPQARPGAPALVAPAPTRPNPPAAPTQQLHKACALVIDDKPVTRSIISSQLRELGVGTVVQCNRVLDARLRLEARHFDIVMCEYHFANSDFNGQDLLDDLRRCNLLPFSTVFVMITSEASYAKVAEAAESALDVYLLKPHSAASLSERINSARKRKISLAPIFSAIESGDFQTGVRLCLQRFSTKGPYWLYAARIGAELMLRLNMHEQAGTLYEAVIAAKTLPWARLGVARVQLDTGDQAGATSTLHSLVGEDPNYADAHDLLGRAQFEQGELTKALETYQRASELTPGSIVRLQKHGALAFHLGDRATGIKALERATALGLGSKMFDSQTLVLLAIARFLERDVRGLQRCLGDLQRLMDKQPDNPRPQRHVAVVQVLSLMQKRQVAEVVAAMAAMAADIKADDFDLEAASNLVSLVAVLTAEELKLEAAPQWVDTVALRHCVSRATTELLARAAQAHAATAERVRAAHTRISAMAEEGMAHKMNNLPRAAVMALLGHGLQTLNIKLINLAQGVLDKSKHPIEGADELRRRIAVLRTRWAGKGESPDTATQHAPGGLALRGAPAANSHSRAGQPASTATAQVS